MATPNFAATIKTFALQQETNEWVILEFSALGFIGTEMITVHLVDNIEHLLFSSL